ncbi:hypothetical protein [Streptomyces chrestomyceticus]|uniref:hypothetical protein n=1 Tax=Streptomyces chrestomyceticus TaxID=68185 RepID=UPI001FD4581D|nr:hypothetical protein [Streptomyces chrestomyceticus]
MIGGRPSEMYDAVASILGMEQLVAANEGLRELAREYEAPAKEAKAELPALLILLDGTDDPRARAAHTALSGRRPDLARAAELAAGTGPADESLLFDLRRRSTLTGPDTEAVATAVTRLREAIASARTCGAPPPRTRCAAPNSSPVRSLTTAPTPPSTPAASRATSPSARSAWAAPEPSVRSPST